VTGLVSGDEDREDERDLCPKRPEDNRSLSLSPMSCEGEGRIVSAEVPGWKSTGTVKSRGGEMRVSSREGCKARSSSDSETVELEFEGERLMPEPGESIAPTRE